MFGNSITASLKPLDFCQKGPPKCLGYYNMHRDFKTKCLKLQCEGLYKHKCFNNLCTTEKKYCDIFRNLNFLLRPINAIKFEREKFINIIKDCSNSIYTFSTDDYCINQNNCLYRENVTRMSRLSNLRLKQTACQCIGNHSYKCGEFCSKHNYACSGLASSSSLNMTKFKHCNNGNKIFNSVFLFPI